MSCADVDGVPKRALCAVTSPYRVCKDSEMNLIGRGLLLRIAILFVPLFPVAILGWGDWKLPNRVAGRRG